MKTILIVFLMASCAPFRDVQKPLILIHLGRQNYIMDSIDRQDTFLYAWGRRQDYDTATMFLNTETKYFSMACGGKVVRAFNLNIGENYFAGWAEVSDGNKTYFEYLNGQIHDNQREDQENRVTVR